MGQRLDLFRRTRTLSDVLVFSDDFGENFIVHKDDYRIVREMMLVQEKNWDENTIWKEVRARVRINENDKDRRVHTFSAQYNDALPPLARLRQLKCLTHLDLGDYSEFIFPNSLWHLKNIEILRLPHSTSNLPEEIGGMTGLTGFQLRNSKISSLPHSIGQLKNLEWLDLGHSWDLVSVPEEIGDLVNLKLLIISCSNIESLPHSIGQLKNLEWLDIGGTMSLSGLPEEIGGMVSLKELNLGCSNIMSLPHSIGQLKNLEYLNLSATKKLEKFPEEIGGMVSLKELNLGSSNIISLPGSIGQLKNLESLDLSSTKKLEKLPEEIGGMVSLKTLCLHCSNIMSLPDSIGQLKNLEYLNLSHTGLSSLPEEIGSMASLKKLYFLSFSKNVMSLPLSIGKLTNLKVLSVRDVTLLPSSVGELKDLQQLFINTLKAKQKGENLVDSMNKLVKSFRSLGGITYSNGTFSNDEEEKLGCALACNRAVAQTSFLNSTDISTRRLTQLLWPCMLAKATRAFDRYNYHYDREPYCEDCISFLGGYHYELPKPDAIYYLLTIHRESFAQLLIH